MNMTSKARPIHASWVVSASALVIGSGLLPGCSRDVQAITPQQLQQQYGISDAYTGQVTTPDGALRGTLVPVTLPDGRKAELIIPDRRANEPHSVYFRDERGLHPIELQAKRKRSGRCASSKPKRVWRWKKPS